MAKQNNSDDSPKIVEFWKTHPDFAVGTGDTTITKAQYDADVAAIVTGEEAITAARTQLTGLIRQQRDRQKMLRTKTTRVKSGVRATYGPDSAEYSQIGGVRQSERKAPKRKPKTP